MKFLRENLSAKKIQKNTRLIYFHCKIYLNIRTSNFLLNRTVISAELQKKKELKLNCVNNLSILQTVKQNDKATCCNTAYTVGSNSGVTLCLNPGFQKYDHHQGVEVPEHYRVSFNPYAPGMIPLD